MSEVLQFPVRTDEAARQGLRASIHRAREAGHQRACNLRSIDGGEIAFVASGIAGRWAFRRNASLGELETVIGILDRLLRAADDLERLECPDA
jgi:hypothetical protein